MSKTTIPIALLQHACGPDPAVNIDAACAMIREAAADGAKLIVTQELFASQYFCQVEDADRFALAEPIPGPTTARLSELAKELGVAISASLFEKRAAGMFHNTSVMIGPDGAIIDRYRKMHIPDDPRFYEKFYFTPGDLGFRAQVLTEPDVTTGMLVCWDQWFPEAARLTAMKGAQVLLYPTAIGWHAPEDDSRGGGEPAEVRIAQREAWQTVMRSHAIANGVYVVAVNRIGREDELVFWGSSFIVDPAGTVIAEAPEDEPAILRAELDLSVIDEQREGWPFLRDRRIDAYGGITERLLDDDASTHTDE